MFFLFFFVLLLLLLNFIYSRDINPDFLSKDLYETVVSFLPSWEANPTPVVYPYTLKSLPSPVKKLDTYVPLKDGTLPDSYNVSELNPQCTYISKIPDQSNCASCWAISVASVLSDRLCLLTNNNVPLSAYILLSCSNFEYDCVDGGDVVKAFEYIMENGIPTGSNYDEDVNTCKPYPYPPCSHFLFGTERYLNCESITQQKPRCVKKCDKNYDKLYANDLFYCSTPYKIEADEEEIKKEIYLNGPVVATFAMWEDFLLYKSGIYSYVDGDFVGYHSVKVIGWGEEDGIKYWLCVNSWNDTWGENGMFKIVRGGNDGVGFEENIIAARPRVYDE